MENKNNHLKRILLVLISALLVFSSIFAGCSSSATVNNSQVSVDIDNDSDIFVDFTADTCDILVGEEKEVKFTAELKDGISKGKVELVDENKKVISEMLDNGEGGDEIAGDNVYTVIALLSNDSRDNVSYYAKYVKSFSKSFDICFYSDISEDEFNGYFQLSKTINKMDDFKTVEKYVKSSKEIIEYNIDKEANTITYKSKYGITGIWTEFSSDYKGSGALAIPESQGLDYETAMENVSFLEKKATLQKNKIAVLRPFRSAQFKYDDFKSVGEILASSTGADLSVIDDENVDLNCMKSLSNYGMIFVDSHGMLANNTPYIVTGEELDAVKLERDPIYSADYISGRIACTSNNCIAIRDTFFDKYYDDTDFENSFVFLGTCYGLYNDNLVNSLMNKSAVTIVGYTDSVTTTYCNETLFETMINSLLLSYDKIDDSVVNARNIYGDIDPYKSENEPECRLDLYGKKDYILCNDIVIDDFTIPKDKTLTLGEIDVIEPETVPTDATGYSIKWTSSDESVASVTPTGEKCIVTSKSKGTTTITGELVSNGKTITKSTNVRVASQGRDTILVLDVSGSMSGTPIDEMKKAAVNFCNELLTDEYNNRVGLVLYDNSIESVDLTNDLDTLIDYIGGISSGGTTNMQSALATAGNMLDSQGKDDNIKNIVIMADGLPNEGETSDTGKMSQLTQYASYRSDVAYANAVINTAENIMNKYNVYSLGFFHDLSNLEKDFAVDLMKLLTNVTDGYHQVDTAENLKFAFGDIQETISDGSKVVINIACPVDVSVTYNGETLSSAQSSYSDTTSFGTLQLLGKNKDIKILSLDPSAVYDIKLNGTDNGTMDYSVNYLDNSNAIIDYRSFESIPITPTTKIDSNTNNAVGDITLNLDEDGDGTVDKIYSASVNGIAKLTYGNEPEEIEIQEEIQPVKTDNSWVTVMVAVIVVVVMLGIILTVVLVSSSDKKKGQNISIPVNKPQEESKTSKGKITLLSGSMKGQEFSLDDGKGYIIGKDSSKSQIVLSYDYSKVSREHCVISYDSNTQMYSVMDMSSNGTYYIDNKTASLNSSSSKNRLSKNASMNMQSGSILVLGDEDCRILLN